MLTDSEKKWLAERAVESCAACRISDEAFCAACTRDPRPKAISVDFFSLSGCDLYPNWQDSAEFEARVSRIMALYLGAPPCGVGTCNNPNFLCPECRLKHARLKAEQEMEE